MEIKFIEQQERWRRADAENKLSSSLHCSFSGTVSYPASPQESYEHTIVTSLNLTPNLLRVAVSDISALDDLAV